MATSWSPYKNQEKWPCFIKSKMAWIYLRQIISSDEQRSSGTQPEVQADLLQDQALCPPISKSSAPPPVTHFFHQLYSSGTNYLQQLSTQLPLKPSRTKHWNVLNNSKFIAVHPNQAPFSQSWWCCLIEEFYRQGQIQIQKTSSSSI